MLGIDGQGAPDHEAPNHEAPDHEAAEREWQRLKDAVAAIAQRLDRLAADAVGKRAEVEQRWLDDLRQHAGRYDAETERRLKDGRRSRLFVRLTRAKTRTWVARLADLLFPTDDRNWGIRPTPVPELVAAMTAPAPGPGMGPGMGPGPAPGMGHSDDAAAAAALIAEAGRRAEAMQAEIEDQLVECRYAAAARDALADAVTLGTGIMKGPVVGGAARRRWRQVQPGVHALVDEADPRPIFTRVDPWTFFPDPTASRIEEVEYTFERHLMTAKDLRALARLPGFDPDAIRRLLRAGARETAPAYLSDLKAISGETTGTDSRFTVWEYHGPLTADEVTDLFVLAGDEAGAADYATADPLAEVAVVVWFCGGEVLKFGPHPLDSGEPLYSAFRFSAEDGSFWGLGVPSLMRDSQAAINAAWRMMMDNGGLSTGPQIVIDRSAVEPADGSWDLTPRKLWITKPGSPRTSPVFEAFHVDSRQGELANTITLARQFADEETLLPIIAQGEQAAHVTQTANGMAMLMNSANVVFREVVKHFDDDMTAPNIRRLYDWNMQFNPKPAIKGDMTVDARGTSVLLVRELQAQNLMALAAQFAAHPVFGPMVKAAPLLRKLIQAHQLTADEIVKSDDEIAQEAQQQAQQQAEIMQQMQQQGPGPEGAPPPDPATDARMQAQQRQADAQMAKIQADVQMAQLDAQTRLEVARMDRETALIKLAEQRNLKLEELQARLAIEASAQQHKERVFAAEVGFKTRQEALRRQATPPGHPIPAPAPGTRFAP